MFISFSDKVYEGDFTLGDHDSELIIIWYLYICNNFNFEKEQACAVASIETALKEMLQQRYMQCKAFTE